jgi:hypothetical protein
MLNSQVSLPENDIGGIDSTNAMLTGLSPFGIGIELGEFILDGDLEFLNQMTIPMNSSM